jgi:cobalt/nickel transport system ATP-binding protein
MADQSRLIELQGVSYSYDTSHPVLKNLDFVLRRGETASLLGANGSGKTTLFHLIMGLLMPDTGRVFVFGEQRRDRKDFHDVRRRIGLLFQDSDDQLFSPTVAEDIAFGPFNLGKSREEVLHIVKDTLAMLGLEGYEDRITYKLSGGEKRLVALGTVLAMRPEILLLDEPVIGLDDEHRHRFMEVLKKGGLSYMVISHDHEFLEEVTETVYLLKEGTLTRI